MLYLKAIYGAVAAGVVSLNASYLASGHIGLGASLQALAAALGAGAVIWGVPNKTAA